MRSPLRLPLIITITAATITALAAAPTTATATTATTTTTACPWTGQHASPTQRANEVLAQMTLDDKIQMVHGASGSPYAGEIPAIPRLCVPALKLEDGPGGVGDGMTGVTQLPAPVTAAASWDTNLTKQYGAVIGNEQWGKGANVDLGPTVNIVRDPRWGRAFESMGEDPYLAGQIGSADIEGVQSQGVMAQVKHWVVYNQETNRNTAQDDAIIDNRTMNEIYMPQFEAAVKQGQASSVMCSYSYINGQPACQDGYTQNTILKNGWQFPGFITSDWGATHSTVASANNGLDMQMPDDSFFGAPLKTAVQNGQVSMQTLNDMVSRILLEEFRFGLFDRQQTGTPSTVVTDTQHANVAKDVAEQGTVLLKNDNNVLPLNTKAANKIAVIGDDAGPDALSTGGGSATVTAPYVVTPFQGIHTRAGQNATVQYAQGDSPNGQLPPVPATAFGTGLTAQYYNNMTLDGTPAVTQTAPNVDYTWGAGGTAASPTAGVHATQWSAKFTGTITPATTGQYTFSLTSDDGSRLFVNGQQIIDNWRDQAPNTETGTVTLTAGQTASIEVDYYQDGGGDMVSLGWQQPGGQSLQDQAVALAKASNVAVVFASNDESEGSDLTNIDLSKDQNDLISAVAAANPNTIVVLNTGSAVTMPWVDDVKGVVEAWYPGQEDGNAIASVLFGDTNPSGKLPVTFPKSLTDVPASTANQWPGVNGQVDYSEGLDVGYRWYTAKDIQPLFAFGAGLSYTTFAFSHLHVGPGSLAPNGTETVQADITNTGRRAGADVVQLYLGEPAAANEPPEQLKGFQKVDLKPGQTKHVVFTLRSRDVSYWDPNAQNWTTAPGTYQLMLGDSSANLPLHGTFQVTDTTGPRYVKAAAPGIINPGATATVTTTFTNGSTETVHNATISLTAPAGWTVSKPTTVRTVAPHGSATATFQVTAPQTAPAGQATITAHVTYAGSDRQAPVNTTATIQVPFTSLAAAMNNAGISDDANPAGGSFDGGGYSYSAQALATVGLTPGGTVTHDGVTFTWPDVPPATPDNVQANSQVIAMSGTGSTLAFVGAGTFGGQTAPVTVTYTDGSTSTGNITMPDWYSDAATPGDELLVTAPHWNTPANTALDPNHMVSVYYSAVPLTAGKTVAAVTLPDNANLHLFAAAIG